MKLKIHHPLILVALLLIIGAVSSTIILLADDPEEEEDVFPTTAVFFPDGPTPVPLTEQDRETAIAIVKKSGIVERINQGQEWKPENIYNTKVSDKSLLRVEAKWSAPVKSSGPWEWIHCSGTIKAVTTGLWGQVTRLVFWVDMDDKSVAGFGVTSTVEDDPQPISQSPDPFPAVKIYDQKTGKIIYQADDGTPHPKDSDICEEGTYYVD